MAKKASHDINNILASINLSTEFLLRGISGPVTAEQKKYLQGILADVKKIAALVKDIKH